MAVGSPYCLPRELYRVRASFVIRWLATMNVVTVRSFSVSGGLAQHALLRGALCLFL